MDKGLYSVRELDASALFRAVPSSWWENVT